MAFWLGSRPGNGDVPAGPGPREFVARLTASKDCQWGDPAVALQPGAYLRQGRRLELAAGFAEITFDSGARIVLEGPAALEVNSAWDATLVRGILKASTPPEAIGFRVSSRAVAVTDLGTEFTLIADAGGDAEVLVLKGEVEAERREASGLHTMVLRESESRRFGFSGISDISDREQKFARFSQPVPLETFAATTRYVRWSFDETQGGLLKADAFGLPLSVYDARVRGSAEAPASGDVRTDGRWQRALRFDGRIFAKAAFPGISRTAPHTVMFWVKVKPDTQLSDAYAMVAWGLDLGELGVHPVHICWNRNPLEGPVGALRTDFLGGFALGATPLRDGRWHHVAVVFAPGEGADTLAQVRQYVDGRLETSASTQGIRRSVPKDVSKDNDTATVNDTVWLGCRLGSDRERRGRFSGELDELVIADGALGPQEIVHVMKDNEPLRSPMMAARE